MKKQIIVLGIYRSGTSLIAGILAKLGIDMGRHENLSHPTKNPKGFFECLDSIDLCEKLRKVCGRNAYDIDKDSYKLIVDDKIVKDYIDKRNVKDIWGVKDPKMLPFFYLFEKYLDNPYIIFIRRNKDSVIKSWKSIKPTMANMVENAYNNHLEMMDEYKLEVIGQKIPFLEIDYSQHIDNPKESAQKIADFIGVENNQEAIEFCNSYSISGKK